MCYGVPIQLVVGHSHPSVTTSTSSIKSEGSPFQYLSASFPLMQSPFSKGRLTRYCAPAKAILSRFQLILACQQQTVLQEWSRHRNNPLISIKVCLPVGAGRPEVPLNQTLIRPKNM